MENLQSKFLWDVADFWVYDKGLREAVNSGDTPVDMRMEIQKKLLSIVQPVDSEPLRQIFDKRKGAIIGLPKSPIRTLVLKFLDSLIKQDVYSAAFEDRPARGGIHRVVLTEAERDRKREANALYKSGEFDAALKIVLELLSKNSKLRCNSGIIGCIVNCYNKLGNYKCALDYAIKLLELEPENKTALGIAALSAQRLELWEQALDYAERCSRLERNVVTLGTAALSAQKLELWGKALSYARQYLELKKDIIMLGIAALSAQKLELWEEALNYAKQCLELERNITILGIAALSAQRLGLWEEVLGYARQYLELGKDVAILGIAALSAQRLGLWEEALGYAEQYMELKIDSTGLGMAMLAARKLKLGDKALSYKERYSRLQEGIPAGPSRDEVIFQ